MQNKSELVRFIDEGNTPEFVFFSGHKSTGSQITEACLSQFYRCTFMDYGVVYYSAEHFMMAEKAKLFNYPEIAQMIVDSYEPKEAKRLGRMIPNFCEKTWVKNRVNIVVQGNKLKFSQNPALLEFLLSTGDKILVEASRHDLVWGIGASDRSTVSANPKEWPGENLLGFALMHVREQLRQNR